MQDRRRTSRRRALSTATLSWPAAARGLDGILRDVSGRGAMLLLDEPLCLPPEVDVALAGKPARRARVVWRGATAVGLAFTAPAPADAAAPAPSSDGRVVSLAVAREARSAPSDADRLAARIAAVLHRTSRPPPDWS